MNPQQWFTEQLHVGRNAFVWSAKQIPEDRRDTQPPAPEELGEWSAQRHIHHMWNYEHNVAIPSMRLWLAEALTPEKYKEHLTAYVSEEGNENNYSYETILDLFTKGRDEQINMLAQFDDTHWEETQKAVWGEPTLHWVVSKTFQHTMEHGNTLMRLILFWDEMI